MPSFEQLLASVGIGSATLHLRLDDAEHPRGSTVTGTLELEGGFVEQRISRLILKLDMYRSGGKSSEVRERERVIVADHLVVQPYSRQSFAFSLHVPDDAWLTWPNAATPSMGCRVDAEADIALAVNPRCSLQLMVTTHREIQAVQAAMRRLGFSERRSVLQEARNAGTPHDVVIRYHPSRELADQVEEAVLTLKVEDDRVIGQLDLNPRETTLGEKMKALVVTQYIVNPLDFDRRALLGTSGKPNPDWAQPKLKKILEEALVLPDNEERRLLRPSQAPKGDTLLRPATARDETNPDELLRPADM